MRAVNKFFKKMIGLTHSSLDRITLHNIEQQMIQEEFDEGLLEEILSVFKKRIDTNDEKEFQNWVYNLNYTIPEEFQNEKSAIQMYEKYSVWLEKEVNKLEGETKLSWEEQTEDIKDVDSRARKTQLVLRHRISEVIMEL